MLHAVVMAGGTGTRFWPQSRHSRPKQLQRLAGKRTMIQATVDRIAADVPPERTWIVTNTAQAQRTAEQLPDVPAANLLIEPCGRNTAPCIGLAAIHLLQNDPDAVMLVMPADHVIRPNEVFLSAVRNAVRTIENSPESLVLFGVPPSRPSTGYGYIERDDATAEQCDAPVYRVASFREKPDENVAKQYMEAGNFYWNCGIFVWRADRILAELQESEPEIYQRCMTLRAAIGTDHWQPTLDTEFPEMKRISIDYAILERSKNVCVIEAPFDWDDVGSWESLPRLLGADDGGNTVDGRHVGLETQRCIIRSTDEKHVVATIGTNDLIIVHTPDATLVCRRGDDAAVRTMVDELKARGYDDVL